MVVEQNEYGIEGMGIEGMGCPGQMGRCDGVSKFPGMGGVGAIDWGALLTSGIDTTGSILTSRYGVPPPGTAIQTKEGSMVRQPDIPGFTAGVFPPMSFGAGGASTWLIIGAGLIAVWAMAKR